MATACALLLAAVLLAAGVAKLRTPITFRTVLRQLLPDRLVRPVAVAVPVAEVAVGALLLSGAAPRPAAAAALLLLCLFSVALARMQRASITLDCGCFGEARDAATPASGLVRNGLLLAIAAVVLVAPAEPPSQQAAADLLAAVTVAGGAACAWLLASTAFAHRSDLRPTPFAG